MVTKILIATHNKGKAREFKELLAKADSEIWSAGDFSMPVPAEDGASFIANAELKTIAARDWFLCHKKNHSKNHGDKNDDKKDSSNASAAHDAKSADDDKKYSSNADAAHDTKSADDEKHNRKHKADAAHDAKCGDDKNNLPDFILADDSGLSVVALGGAPGIFSARWAGADNDFDVAMEKIKKELLAKNIPLADLTKPHLPAYFSCALSLFVRANQKIISVVGEAHGFLQFPPSGDNGFGYDPIFVPTEELNGAGRTFANMPTVEKEKISHRTHAMNLLRAACQKDKIDF